MDRHAQAYTGRKQTKQTDRYTDSKLLFNLSKLGQEEFISFINETPVTTLYGLTNLNRTKVHLKEIFRK